MFMKYALLCPLAFCSIAQAYTVELAVSFDSAADSLARSYYGTTAENRIKTLVSTSNTWFQLQSIPITLKVNVINFTFTGTPQYPASPGASSENLSEMNGLMGSKKLRDAFEADYRVHFTAGQTGLCGIAGVRSSVETINTTSTNSIVDIGCNAYVLSHELGHNFGLQHSARDFNPNYGVFTYGKGYGVDNSFATIMAYTSHYGSATKLNRWSEQYAYVAPYGVIGAPDANAKLALSQIAVNVSTAGETCRSDVTSSVNPWCATSMPPIKVYHTWSEGAETKTVTATKLSNGYFAYTTPINTTSRTNVKLQMMYQWSATSATLLRTCGYRNTEAGYAYKFEMDHNSTTCKSTRL
jgi:hypothetical protein